MNAEEAQRLLAQLNPTEVCRACGLENPLVRVWRGAHGTFRVHDQCPKQHAVPSDTRDHGVVHFAYPAPSVKEVTDALTSLVLLEGHLKTALSYCYEPADQTVQCPECNTVWWGCEEDLDEDWHAPGCGLLAARVLVGLSKPVRKRPPEDPSQPYQPNTPNPDGRTHAEAVRDQVLSGWFARLMKMSWGEEPPTGVSEKSWKASVHEVFDRLRKMGAPKRGPYSNGV